MTTSSGHVSSSESSNVSREELAAAKAAERERRQAAISAGKGRNNRKSSSLACPPAMLPACRGFAAARIVEHMNPCLSQGCDEHVFESLGHTHYLHAGSR
jgi:hypothetical protein